MTGRKLLGFGKRRILRESEQREPEPPAASVPESDDFYVNYGPQVLPGDGLSRNVFTFHNLPYRGTTGTFDLLPRNQLPKKRQPKWGVQLVGLTTIPDLPLYTAIAMALESHHPVSRDQGLLAINAQEFLASSLQCQKALITSTRANKDGVMHEFGVEQKVSLFMERYDDTPITELPGIVCEAIFGVKDPEAVQQAYEWTFGRVPTLTLASKTIKRGVTLYELSAGIVGVGDRDVRGAVHRMYWRDLQ